MHSPNQTIHDDEPLRIAFFTDFYAPQINGVAVSLRLLAGGLRQAGHEVTIFAPRAGRCHEVEAGVQRLPSVRVMRRPPVYAIVPGTTHTLRRCLFDIVHMHTPMMAGALACLSARQRHVPLIYTYHASITDFTQYFRAVGRTRLAGRAARRFSALGGNLSDYVVAPSAKAERVLRGQQVRRPIRVIPNGIDLECFQRSSRPGAFRRSLGVGAEARLLVSVGRLDPEKSLDFMIDAFAGLAAQLPDSHLVFAGDGRARPALERQAAATRLAHRIHFLGMVNRADLPDLLHDADLFLSASTAEVHPLAAIEAAAAGLPIVAVRDEALEGIIADHVNGRLTPREIGPFVAAAAGLLNDGEMRHSYGQASLTISRKFTLEAQTEAMVTLYREAVACHAG